MLPFSLVDCPILNMADERPTQQQPADDAAHATHDNTQTVGAEPIDKNQPWRNIVKQDKFAQPDFFSDKPNADSNSKIRLLQELDSKSR